MNRIAVLCALCVFLIAAPSPAPSRAAGVIRVGHPGYVSDIGLFIAQDKGYFREQGVVVSFEPVTGGAEQVALLGTGRLEIATGAFSPTLFNAIARGLPIVAVADKGSVRDGFGYAALVVRKALVDSGRYRSLKDLRGLVLATPDNASPSPFLYYVVLKHAGMTMRDVTMGYVGVLDQPIAMANGKIDASMMGEPLVSAVEARGIGKVVLTVDQVLPKFEFGMILYNTDWARRHPQEARRWMVAYVKALRYYNEAFRTPRGRDDLITIMISHTAIKDRAVWKRMRWPGLDPDGMVDIRGQMDYQRWLLNEHQVTQFILPDRLVDLSYARDAANVLGPFQL